MGYIMLEYTACVLAVFSFATLLFFVQLVLMLAHEGIAYILERSATLTGRPRKSSRTESGSKKHYGTVRSNGGMSLKTTRPCIAAGVVLE
jgi:hypothetical protein